MITTVKSRILEIKNLHKNDPEVLSHINEVIDIITDHCLASLALAFAKARKKQSSSPEATHGN